MIHAHSWHSASVVAMELMRVYMLKVQVSCEVTKKKANKGYPLFNFVEHTLKDKWIAYFFWVVIERVDIIQAKPNLMDPTYVRLPAVPLARTRSFNEIFDRKHTLVRKIWLLVWTMRLGSFVTTILRGDRIQRAKIVAYTHLIASCSDTQPIPLPSIPPKFLISSQIHLVPAKLRRHGWRIEEPRQDSDVG